MHCGRPRSATAHRVVIVRVPFPIADPSQVVEAYLEAVTPRTRFALVSHVTSPTALVMPVAALVRELDRRGVDTLVDGAHAPGMVPARPRAAGGRVLDRERAQVAVRAEGRGDPPRPRRPPCRDPAAGHVSHGANDERTRPLALPPRFDWTGTDDPTPYLAMPAAIRYVGGLHDDGWSGLMAANEALARPGRDRLCAALGIAPPAPDAMLGSMAAVPLPDLTHGGRGGSRCRRRCSRRTGSRSR